MILICLVQLGCGSSIETTHSDSSGQREYTVEELFPDEPEYRIMVREEQPEAYERTKKVVLENLKSPGSAQFEEQPIDKLVVKRSDRYIVKSWVDSQNGFGALLRTYFTVEWIRTGEGPNDWRLWEASYTDSPQKEVFADSE